MAEVGFFPKYEQKENRVTNYTLLVLKQIYNESPNLFQELIVNLLAGECDSIDVGVSFSQQEGFSCEKGKSIIDGVIKQMPFEIFIETKNTDWFYSDQLERHLSNLSNQNGKKVFLALANFDGLADEKKLFEDLKEKFSTDDLIIKNIEFEELKTELEKISGKIKSEILSLMVKEYEQFLNESNLLPTWKYRLDVVNCAKSKKDVMDRMLYICPEAKGAYKHARSKYFGIYENKAVNCIAEIKAVCTIDYDEQDKELVDISWYDKDNYTREEILEEARQKTQYCWGEPAQMFLLNNFRENVSFEKDSSGGMFGSKIYFNFDSNIKNIDDLAETIKNKKWSDFQ